MNVRKAAMKLQDKSLLAKLSAEDLIAQDDAQYHLNCLNSLYNRARETKSSEDFYRDRMNHGLAFAELVSYIEETRMNTLVTPIFKLSDLVTLHRTRLEQLENNVVRRVHSSGRKKRILAYFLDMKPHKQGRDIILVSNECVGHALRKACEHDADDEAVHLARAAKIVRRDMHKMKNQFAGSFEPNSKQESVPMSLLQLVAMVLNGPNIKVQSSSSTIPQPVLTISQLLTSNSIIRRRENQHTLRTKRSQVRETPLLIYLGILVHTKTHKRELVDRLYELGLSISYDRVLTILVELGDNICHYYKMQKAVYLTELKGGLFTTEGVDNIDHNPSSTNSHDSFHETGILLFQHPDQEFSGTFRVVTAQTSREVGGDKKKMNTGTNISMYVLQLAEATEAVVDSDSDSTREDESISWAAYHARQRLLQSSTDISIALTSLLPLFQDEAKSVALIRHSMDIMKTAVHILNPG